MRIALGGFLHESHSFAPLPTTFDDFTKPGAWSPIQRGAAMIEHLRPTSAPAAGAIRVLEEGKHTILPLTWCIANPAGPVQASAFERITAMIVADLSEAMRQGPIDGVYLDLHGAMVSDDFPDGEGEILRRVRAVVGEIPVTASLDPHANLTRQMVDHADAVVPFRTYPHVDMKDAAARAVRRLIERIERKKQFAKAWVPLDFWIPITSQCTLMDPMAAAMGERSRIAAMHKVAELAFCFGFPYADFDGCQPAIAAFADTQEAADAAVAEMKAWLDSRESSFKLDVLPAAEAVAQAIAVTSDKPVVIADTQDNPGGGGHGDTTGLLAELIAQNAQGAVLAIINDAESAAACHAAGEGAEVKLSLGGKSDGAPLAVTAKVEKLADGKFTLTGPMGAGNPSDLGASALLLVAPGVRVIVTSRKMQAYDQALFRHLGLEPAEQKILALKSSVHFRADFAPMAERVIVAAAPGPVAADPSVFPFKHLRAGVRLKPREA